MKTFKRVMIFTTISLFIMGCVKNLPKETQIYDTPVDGEDLYFQLMLAAYMQNSGQVADAIDHYKTIIEKYPQNAEAYYRFGKFLSDLSIISPKKEEKKEFFNSSVNMLENAIKINPRLTAAGVLLADLYIEANKFNRAISQLENMKSLHDFDIENQLKLIKLYIQTGQLTKTQISLEEINAKEGDLPEITKLFALYYAKNRQYDLAINYYKEYLDLNKDDYESLYNLALVYLEKGDIPNGKKALIRIVDKFPSTSEIRFQIAEIFRELNDYKYAIEILKPLLKDEKSALSTNINIGKIYLFNIDPKQSIHWFKTAQQLNPDNQFANFYLALAYAENGNYEKALNVLEIFSELDNLPMDIIDLYVQIYMREGEDLRAIGFIEQQISKNPSNIALYQILSNIYLSKDEVNSALNTFRRGLNAEPDSKTLTLDLGLLLEKLGKWEEAVSVVEKLQKKNETDAELNNFIGYTLADNNADLEKALELIKRAIEKKPDNPAFIDSLGWVHFRLGNYQRAAEYLKKAVEKMPNDPLVVDHYIQVLIKLEEFAEAKSHTEKFLETDPQNQAILKHLEKLQKIELQ